MTELINNFCHFDEGMAKLFGLTALNYAYAISLAIVAMTVAFIMAWRTYWSVLRAQGFSHRISGMAEWFVVGVALFNISVVMSRAYGREIVSCPYDVLITVAATAPAFLIGYISHWYAGNKGSIRDFLVYVSAPVAAEVAFGSRAIANEVIRIGFWLFKAAT
jgi:hypothetical protein